MRAATFMQIYNDLHHSITEGELRPGMILPSENALAQRYSTSRPTVRKAIKLLVEQSLIESRQGIGSVVMDQDRVRPLVIAIDLALSYATQLDYYYPKILQGIRETVDNGKHKLRLISATDDLLKLSSDVDGFILSAAKNDPENFDELARISQKGGRPMVLLNRMPTNPELSYIAVDYNREMSRTVKLLLRNGAANIIMYAPASYISTIFDQRINGYRQAFRALNRAVPEDLIIDGSVPNPTTALKDLLSSRKIDALFIARGEEIFSAMQVVIASGLKIPEDISIFCFDDMEQFSQRQEIPISFIKMPLNMMGRMAAEHLIQRKLNPAVPPMRQVVDASLVINGCQFLL